MAADQEIIDHIRKGNKGAFADLVDKYKNYVFTIAIGVVNRREDAEEITQDVFVKVYQMLHTFQGNSSFKTWLYSITYRTSIDYTRKNKKHHYAEIDQALPLKEQVEANNGDKDHMRAVLSKLISSLKPEDAAIITLFYLEELSVKEISEITGINPNNIKTKLFRLREHLRKTLENDWKVNLNDLL